MFYFKELKQRILALAESAVKDGILPKEQIKEIEDTLEKIKIRIGVCGQVKTGKSTFINALLFGKNILLWHPLP